MIYQSSKRTREGLVPFRSTGDVARYVAPAPPLPDLVSGGTYYKVDGTPVVITPISGETTAIRLLVAATGPMKTALVLTFTGSPVIDWGDGTTTSPTSGVSTVHTYDGVNPIPCGRPWGAYLITITGGTVTGIASSSNSSDWDGYYGNITSIAIKSANITTAQYVADAGQVKNTLCEAIYINAPLANWSYLIYAAASLRSLLLFSSGPAAAFAGLTTGGVIPSQLLTADFSNIKISGDFTAQYIFGYATSILYNPANTEIGNIDIRRNALSTAAFVALFNSLPTVTAKTLQIGGSAAALALTAEQIAIATAKGWTVTRSY